MTMMEQLQRIFSTWSTEDVNTVLRLCNGDCQYAVSSILEHERSGLPAAALIRSLGGSRDNDKGDPYGGLQRRRPWQQAQQQAGAGIPAFGVGAAAIDDLAKGGGRIIDHDVLLSDEMAAHPSPYAMSASSRGLLNPFDAVPHFVQVESKSYGNGTRGSDPRSNLLSRGIHQPLSNGLRQDALLAPEVLVQRLSPSEKDQVLLQLLAQPERFAARQDKREEKFLGRDKEFDILNVQSGILMSFKEEPKSKSSGNEDVDEEALEMGIRASQLESEQLRLKQHQAEELESYLVERAKFESLKRPTHVEEEASLIEEAVRESLSMRTISKEDQLIEDVKRDSLMSCYPMTLEGSSFQEDLTDASLARAVSLERSGLGLERSESLTLENVARIAPSTTLTFGRNRKSSLSELTSPFADEDLLIEDVAWAPDMPREESVGDTSSIQSDRKPPARDLLQVNDASTQWALVQADIPLASNAHIGVYDALCSYEVNIFSDGSSQSDA